MNDHRDPQTESQIRRALSARAEEISVSPDALSNITTGGSPSPWARPLAYAAVASVIVALLVGVAILTDPGENGSGLDSADDGDNPTTSAPPDTAPSTTEPEPTSTDPEPTATPPPSSSIPGQEVSYSTALREPLPVAPATMAERNLPRWRAPEQMPAADAAALFVADELGIAGAELSDTTYALAEGLSSPNTDAFGVHRRGEDGSTLDSFAFKVLVVSPPDSAPVVTHVVTAAFRIHHVEDSQTGGLRITGTGNAFEGSAVLDVDEASTLISVGSGGYDAFSTIVDLPEHCPCVVTITGATGFAGEIPEIASYSVLPQSLSTTYSVFGVAEDDVLNVRSGPGVSNPIVTSFAPDEVGIIVTGGEEFVGTARWWEVQTEDARGWVHSQFLVANRDISLTPGIETQLMESYLQRIPSLDPSLFAETVEFGGIGVYADWPTPWTTVGRDSFDVERNWSPEGTEDRTCDCDMTVEEFLGFDTAKWDLAEYSVDEPYAPASFDGNPDTRFWATGQFASIDDRFVTGAIFIPEPNPDEALDWRHYTVVFDFEDGTPRVKGIWRWGWTP